MEKQTGYGNGEQDKLTDEELELLLDMVNVFVGGTVVREHSLDVHAPCVEPAHGPTKHSDRCDCGLVVMDLGVSDTGVVIDDGVHECHANLHASVFAAWFVRCHGPVLQALLTANKTPPATVGDIAEFLHVYVDHRAGLVVFVTPDRFPGSDINVPQPVQPATNQHSVDR